MWVFILLLLLVLCIVAAAIVLPLEFLVFRNRNKENTGQDIGNCEKSLMCQNGGSSVITQGMCSCICTNGFTGPDCSRGGNIGCTTTDMVATDGVFRINDVTLGRAIPRIIADANKNFSIPLSGTTIMAKLNSADLSCIAQNSLVTFDSRSTRLDQVQSEIPGPSNGSTNLMENANEMIVPILTITPPSIKAPRALSEDSLRDKTVMTSVSVTSPPGITTIVTTKASISSTVGGPTPTAAFTVTEEVLDFARVAVLYVLQEESIDAANTAQNDLQFFFSKVDKSKTLLGDDATQKEALSLSIGGNNVVDLLGYTIELGSGRIGGKAVKRFIHSDLRSAKEPIHSAAMAIEPNFPRGLRACR